MAEVIRSILSVVDDPHEFATVYADHVEKARSEGVEPLPVTVIASHYLKARHG